MDHEMDRKLPQGKRNHSHDQSTNNQRIPAEYRNSARISFFFLLYLFYNADLLDICNRPGTNAAGMGFVDDVNILAYGKSTEEDCKTLEKIHNDCERWAARHGSVFAPHKYELIHLAKNPKKLNLDASFAVRGKILKSKTSIRVLGVYIDTRLDWAAHYKGIQKKMTRQTMALTKIVASTWGDDPPTSPPRVHSSDTPCRTAR